MTNDILDFTFSYKDIVRREQDELSLDKIKIHIQCILDHSFPNSNKSKMDEFNTRLNFACPICGDSVTDDLKKRGNLYYKNMNYKCFNCGIRMSLFNFIKEYKEYCSLNDEDLYVFRNYQSTIDSLNISTTKLDFFDLEQLKKFTITKSKLKELLGFVDVKNTKGETFLKNRYQKNLTNFLYQPKGDSLIILNGIDDIILGYQIRPIKQKKYYTYKLSKIYKECGLDITESVTNLDNISSIYNILNINFNRTVTVFEGPMDCYLYNNSIALAGAHNVLDFDIENMQYWFDNDETGSHKAINKLKEGSKIFLWKKYLNAINVSDKIKDLNDLVIYSKIHDIKLIPFDDYFSNNKLNMIYV